MGKGKVFMVAAAGLIASSALGGGSSRSARARDLAMCVRECVSASNGEGGKEFTTQFSLQDCTFSTTGRNRYFILVPGHRLTLRGVEGKEGIEAQITVLSEEQRIVLPGVGEIMTRVIEEREWSDGVLDEVSRNFYAICDQTNSVFYFGEDVDIYEDGQVVSHGGGWRAGVNGAAPGLFMPGTFLLGSRYFQEIAPAVAMDRAENVKMGLTVDVPAGRFTDAVQVLETSPLEPSAKEYKLYAPGVGVIVDDTLMLVDVFDPSP